ncbi:MAG: diguanylate cyclase [Coprobacillus sp.]
MQNNILKTLSDQELYIISRQSGILICRYYMSTHTVENLFDSPEKRFGISTVQENVSDYVVNHKIVSNDTKDAYLNIFKMMDEGIPAGNDDIKFRLEDGEYHWHHVDYSLIYDENDIPLYALITFFENSKEREMALAAEKWHSSLSTLLTDALFYAELNLSKNVIERIEDNVDIIEKSHFISLDDVVKYITSVEMDEKIRNEFNSFAERKRLLGLFSQGVEEDHMDFFVILKSQPIYIRANVKMAKYPHSNDVMGLISLLKLDNQYADFELLSHKAFHDSLTGLLNREGIEKNSLSLLSHYDPKKNTALFMIDLDDFKQINDCLGHQVGDMVLKQVGATLTKVFRQTDIVGRLGGDEFVVLLTGDFSINFLKRKALEVLQTMKLPKNNQKDIAIGTSIGIAFSQGKVSFEKLYGIADIALYSAKRSGKETFRLINADTNDEHGLDSEELSSELLSLQSLIDDNSSSNRTAYEALIENVPGGVVILTINDKGLQVTHCNDWAMRLTGHLTEELDVGHRGDIYYFIHTDDIEEIKKKIYEVNNGLDNISITYRLRHIDGHYIHIVLNATVTERRSDEIILYGIQTDIEELINVQNELESSRKKLETIIEAMPGGIAVINITDGIEFNYSSDWVYKYCGYSPNVFESIREGMRFNTVYKEDIPIALEAVKEIKNGLDSVHVCLRLNHQSGIPKYVNIDGTVIERADEKVVLYAVFTATQGPNV